MEVPGPIELPHSKLREQPRNSIGFDGGPELKGRILLDLNGEHLCSSTRGRAICVL